MINNFCSYDEVENCPLGNHYAPNDVCHTVYEIHWLHIGDKLEKGTKLYMVCALDDDNAKAMLRLLNNWNSQSCFWKYWCDEL